MKSVYKMTFIFLGAMSDRLALCMEVKLAVSQEIATAESKRHLDSAVAHLHRTENEKAKEYGEVAAAREVDKACIVLPSVPLEGTKRIDELKVVSHEVALARIANLVELGKILLEEKNFTVAHNCFQEASSQTDDLKSAADSCYHLGVMFSEGIGVEKDYVKARQYFEKSLGIPAPFANRWMLYVFIGYLYSNGLGVPINAEKGDGYFEKGLELAEEYAAQNEDLLLKVGALFFLGNIFLKAQDGGKDYGKARLYFEQALDCEVYFDDIWEVHYRLGEIYHEGIEVDKDCEKGRHFYLKCAQQNENLIVKIHSLYRLGASFYEKDAPEKDYLRAREYFEQAVDMNLPFSEQWSLFNRLREIYTDGLGCTKDSEKARMYSEKCKDHEGDLDPKTYTFLHSIYHQLRTSKE